MNHYVSQIFKQIDTDTLITYLPILTPLRINTEIKTFTGFSEELANLC